MSGRKLRVGFFIDAYTPGAGTENQLRGILQNLDKARVEATLVTLRDPVPDKHREDIPWPVECLHVGSLFSPSAVARFFRLVSWLRKERFDIAMIYFVDTNQFVVPACKLAGVKSIVVNRRDMGYWYTKSLLFRLNAVNRMADYFLVNSNAVRELVAEREHFPRERIRVIYNGLWEKVSPGSPIPKAALGIPEDSPIVGIVASLRPVKRIDRFIEVAAMAFKAVPPTHFLILGQGELEAPLKAQVSQLGIADRIHFVGQVANVQSYLQVFDVGLLTSESEGLSNTLMEYAVAGVPAVAFDTGGNREVIVDGKTGFLASDGDVAQMAAKVIAVLTDNELRRRLSDQSRESVRERFSAETINRELLALFDDIS